MADTEKKAELNYIVWQYLQKESPSLAVKFKKSKKIKPREEAEVTLFNLYDLYTRNKSDATKRKSDSEIEETPEYKRSCLSEDENSIEDGQSGINEKDVGRGKRSKQNHKEGVKSGGIKRESEVEISPVSKKVCLSQEEKGVEDDITGVSEKKVDREQRSNKNDTGDDKSDAAEVEIEKSPIDNKACVSQEEENIEDSIVEVTEKEVNRQKGSEENDKLNEEDDKSDDEERLNEEQKNVDKITEREASVSSEECSEKKPSAESETKKEKKKKKALLPKPKRKKTLLSAPFSSIHKNDPNFYNTEDRRKILLPQPSRRSGRKSLLAAPLPPYLDSEGTRKTLLPEPLPPLPQQKRAGVPLLMEPLPPLPLALQDRKSRIDRMGLLDESPPLGPLYSGSKGRAPLLSHPLESDHPDVMRRRERRALLDGPPYSVDDNVSRRRILSDEHEFDDLSQFYLRRAQTKEPTSETSLWEDEEAVLLARLKNCLKRLSRSSEKFAGMAERLGLADKPTGSQDFEVPRSRGIPHPSHLSPDSYARYMWEKNASLTRRDQMLPESSGLIDKLEVMRKEAISHNEAIIRKYEEELKSIGVNMTPEMSNAFRRATENEFRSSNRRLQERYDQKMGFL